MVCVHVKVRLLMKCSLIFDSSESTGFKRCTAAHGKLKGGSVGRSESVRDRGMSELGPGGGGGGSGWSGCHQPLPQLREVCPQC